MLLALFQFSGLKPADINRCIIGIVVPAALHNSRRLAREWLLTESLVVADFGTATTFEVVDEDGAYLGGVIAPGINFSLVALHSVAARLPRIGIGRPQAAGGRDTIAAMQSGIFWGYVGLIAGIIGRIRAEHETRMKVVETGGLAPLLAEGTTTLERIDPDLTLEGLRLLADRNPAPISGKIS